MATFLDVTGLAQFTDVFIFIIVAVLLFMLMQVSKFLGSNKAFHGILAIIIALLIWITPMANNILKSIIPWVGVVLILIVIAIIGMKSVGGATIPGLSNFKFLVILILVLAAVVAGMFQIRQNVTIPGDTVEGEEMERNYDNIFHILFHPRVLGIFLIGIIAVFTIVLMTAKTT